MNVEPTPVVLKRSRPKLTVVTDAPAKPKRKTLSASRKKPQASAAVELMPHIDLQAAIATTAFFIAAERGFAPGHELDDWLEAERRVQAAIAS